MKDIQEEAMFKMKNKGEKAVESWNKLYAKVRDTRKFRNIGEDSAFEKLWILKGKW